MNQIVLLVAFTLAWQAWAGPLPAASEAGIYNENLKDNFQLFWPGDNIKDFAQAKPLAQDLMDVTVSFWVRHRVTDHSQTYFSYGIDGTKETVTGLLFYVGANWHIYVTINDKYIKCPGYAQPNSWQHYVVSWSNVKGEMKVYIDGNVFCESILRKGDTIKKGGNFTLGQFVTKWGTPITFHKGYSFRGDMAYLNVYDRFTNTTEEYETLRSMTMSDGDAIIPWEEFRTRTFGSIRILPEYDLYGASFTHLECGTNSMTLTVKRKGFPHLDPDEVVLLDGSCGPSTVNETHLVFKMDLRSCGTLVNFTETYASYTNEVRAKGALQLPLSNAVDTINRRPVGKTQRRMSFKCDYELAERVHNPLYVPHISNINNHAFGTNRFNYRISLFHSANFTQPYNQSEYPINIEMEERVYVEVAVVGMETRLDNWIKTCRATPSANFGDSIKYDLISEGCPNKQDDSIQFHETTEIGKKRFSFETFRFNKFPTAVVFLHCDMVLCNIGDSNSRCSKGLTVC